MTTTKKIPALLGADTGYRMILVADSTAATTNPIAHPARSKSGTGHFCTETARVQRQSDAEWLAEYDGADSLVQPGGSGIIRHGTNYTKSKASNLYVNEVFPHPDFIGLGVGRLYPQGRAHRFGGVVKPHVHSSGLTNQRMVFEIPKGIKAMKPTTTPATQGTPHHDHQQAALVLRATTHLSEALYQLRNNTGTTPTRKAMGLAYAAARSLSQVVGGVHHV